MFILLNVQGQYANIVWLQSQDKTERSTWRVVRSRYVISLIVGVQKTDRLGVDACNTVLGVFIFAATMNLGQSWSTVLTLWGGMLLLHLS